MNPDMANNFYCGGGNRITMNNHKEITLTKEELERRRLVSLQQSAKAVIQFPECYAEMKRILDHVVTNKIDIDEYDAIACTLAGLIEKMGTDTIFYHYFHENINPKKMGKAKYFRFFCRDLLMQVDELARWRYAKRNISLVK